MTDPLTGQINQVAIDMDTTGNAPGTGSPNLLGPVDSAFGGVPLGSTHFVDVIVDEVAPADGNITGFGFDLHYNSAVVNIDGHATDTGTEGSYMVAPGGFEPGVVPDPDATGSWRIDFDTLGAGSHRGEGILVRVGIKCVGTTPGSSFLTIDDSTNDIPGSEPQIFTHTNTHGDPTVEMPVNHVGNATIYCGEPVPPPSDLTVSNTTTASPGSATAGVSFPVTVDATVRNVGPTGPATGDVTEVLSMPADCMAVGGPAKTVTGLSLPVSTNVVVPRETYSVTCTGTSFHNFSDTATISIDSADTGHLDPNSANNSAASAVSTTAVTGTADPAITASSATSSAPSECLPPMPPASNCVSAPTVRIGQPQTVTVHKTIDNLSGANPVNVSDAVTWTGANEAPGGSNNQNPCTPSGVNQCTWSDGTTCTVVPTGANPQTASVGPALTLDFTFTATCTADSFFDFNNPERIALLFQDSLSPVDTHTTDSNLANNVVAPITLSFWNTAFSDLSAAVSGSGPVYAGNPVTDTVTVTNSGPATATNVRLTDTLSGPYTFNFAAASQGGCSLSVAIVCSLGNIGAGSSATVTFDVTATTDGTIINSASVTANQFDPNSSNNSASASTTVMPSTDISIVMSAFPNPTNFGGTLTYTMAVTNHGPSPATGVYLEDHLPGGVAFFSATGSQGSCIQDTGIDCTLGAIASGGTATAVITVTPTLVGTITNTASVSGNEFDPVSSNNTSTIQTVTVGSTGYDLTGIWSGEFDNAALGQCTAALAQTGSGLASLSGSMFCTAASGGSLTGNFNIVSRRINLVATFAQPSYTVTISNGLLSQDLTTLFGTWTCSCLSGAQAFFMARSQPSTNAIVSASTGGMLQTATGDMLTIPPGALNSDTTLTSLIQTAPAPAPSGLTAISRAYDFGPSGTTFSHPVTAVFHYTDADLAGGLVDPATLRVWVYDSVAGWQLLGGTVDTAAKTITASLNHFSEYALFGNIPSQADSDSDGVVNSVDNCPNWSNELQSLPAWPVPAGDTDCDGFTTVIENFIGTDPTKHCGANAWPLDFNNDGRATISDVLKFSPSFNTMGPGAPYNVRFDLNGDNRINLSDVLKFSPFFNRSCSP